MGICGNKKLFFFFFFSLWRCFVLAKFFLLNIVCLHWTFICVDFLLHFFFFISHAVQLLDARRTKVCPLSAACLFFFSAQPHFPMCFDCVCLCLHLSLLLADAVILFTKPIHSFICKNKVLVCVKL